MLCEFEQNKLLCDVNWTGRQGRVELHPKYRFYIFT